MASDTFYGGDEFIVPDDNSSVTLTCYGEDGGDGNADGDSKFGTDASDGADGGKAEGTLSVNPGDTLYIKRLPGGNGPNNGDAQAGGGGDGIAVAKNNDSESAVVIAAGGGGGGGAGAADEHDDPGASSGAGGAGGGGGNNGEDATYTGISDADGGTGGGSGSLDGSGGDSDSDSSSAIKADAAGGGGGGGYNGGGGGEANAYVYDGGERAVGAGGGGGDGYIGGVSNANQSAGVHTGSEQVVIEYTPTPNPPENLTFTPNPDVPEVQLEWDIYDSIVDGYYVYRDTSPSVPIDSANRVATINNGSTMSYTDTDVVHGGEYYYRVTAFESTSGNESTASNEEGGQVAHMVKIEQNGSYNEYPLRVRNPDTGEYDYPSDLKTRDSNGNYN